MLLTALIIVAVSYIFKSQHIRWQMHSVCCVHCLLYWYVWHTITHSLKYQSISILCHRHSQAVHMHPQSREKFFSWPHLQGKVVSAPPKQSKSPIFWGYCGDLDGGRSYLRSFSVCFWGRRLKKVVNFLGKKSAPPDKILATPVFYVLSSTKFNEDSNAVLTCLGKVCAVLVGTGHSHAE